MEPLGPSKHADLVTGGLSSANLKCDISSQRVKDITFDVHLRTAEMKDKRQI